MKTTNKIIIAVLIIAVLLVSVGYAAIQNITLNISGTATGTADDANFKVKFLETTEVSDSSKVTATVTNDTNAAINVVGVSAKGQIVTATYTVQNVSTDLSANLSVNTTNNNEEYFAIESNLGKTSLIAGEVTTLTVTVEVIKTPIATDEVALIGIGLIAEPVQPGEEGGSGSGTGGSSGTTETTTLASVTTDNIGDYIDLRNNIVGTSATTDDWRILYIDGNNVYAILADYLPNSTNYAANAGLETMGTYGVYSNTNRDALVTALATSQNWNGLANGISGATVIGAATGEVAIASYYLKTGVDVSKTGKLDSSIEDYDLYTPHTNEIEECEGIWVNMISESEPTWLLTLTCSGETLYKPYDYPYLAIRPMVVIPASTTVTKEGDIWTMPLEATNGETNGGVEKEETTEPIETTLGAVTTENIGEYIDLGNNIVGGNSTSDDWRILYVENNKVYAILADYLPNSTGYAKNVGLDISKSETEDYRYSVYSKTNRDTLLNGLTTTSNWQGLANGINGATVTGAPTADLLMKSYNKKNGTEVDYTTYPTLENSYLYTTHTNSVDNCYGYWLASPREDGTDNVWHVSYYGNVSGNSYRSTFDGVRPVVCLSSDINVVKNGTLWIVEK